MNRLLSFLDDICRRHPGAEKVLVAPDLVSGRETSLALAAAGRGWVNLRVETTAGLALQVAGAVLARGKIRFLPGYLTELVLEEVLQEMEAARVLRYYRRPAGSAGLVRALANTVFELRMTSHGAQDVPRRGLAAPGKGSDLRAVLSAFERYLSANNCTDFPGLLQTALAVTEAGENGAAPVAAPAGRAAGKSIPERIFLVPSFTHFYPLEKELLVRLAGGRPVVLPGEPVFGLRVPEGYWTAAECAPDDPFRPAKGCGVRPDRPAAEERDVSGEKTAAGGTPVVCDTERLAWLYRVDEAPPPRRDGSLQFFHACGVTAEVREVFRRIAAAGLTLDQVSVVYTAESYVPLFYTLARRFGVGLTVAEGVPVSLTGPGRALRGLLDWVRSGFSARVFGDLLTAGEVRLRLPGDGPGVSGVSAARLLREAGIGRGRERYRLLAELARAYRRRAESAVEDDGRRAWLLARADLAGELCRLFADLLALVPRPDGEGRVNFAALAEGLAALLSRLSVVKDEMDRAARECLLQFLGDGAGFTTLRLPVEQALQRVAEAAAGLRAGAGGSRPGCLHLVGYQRAVWTHRPGNFFVGLDADTFPGSGRQDPVLLDDERECFPRSLPRSAGRLRENLYAMVQALASRRGRVWLSFSAYDPAQNRSSAPSPLFLQACRLAAGDPALDYTDLLRRLGHPAAWCPRDGEPALDETEWWLRRFLRGAGAAAQDLARCYPGLARGLEAKEARKENRLTVYDGRLAPPGGEFDGTEVLPAVFSCGRLETLAACPFRYFLQYVLQIAPPADRDYDDGRWLAPAERGELLHRIFYLFMRRVGERGERPDPGRHRELLMETAEELLACYRHRFPVPGEAVFARERREIRRACEVFLAAEGQLPSHVRPAYFEVPFGLGEEAVALAGCGLPEPLALLLDNGTEIRVSGKIDRIDRAGRGIYHVWDYKTGGDGEYDEKDFLKQGRQLQHAIYALAAEKLLAVLHPQESPRVQTAGYYFPTERGAGRRLARERDGRGSLMTALGHLYALLAGGIFLPTSEADRCRYCDYRQACGGEEAAARSRALFSGGDPVLAPWQALQEIV